MKKTLTVNLGGTVYHIDDDAYRLLDNYLSNLKHYFRKQEGAEEIVDDIEMRIAELFAEKVTEGKQLPQEYIKGLSIVCEDFMYGIKTFNTCGCKSAKEMITQINNILDNWLPF